MANVSFSNLRGPALSLNQVNAVTKYNASPVLTILPGTPVALTDPQLADWVASGVMFATTTGASQVAHTLGADSLSRALQLIQIFGVDNHSSILLEIQRANGGVGATGADSIANVGGTTSTNVQFALNGTPIAGTVEFALALATSSSAYVRVSQVGVGIILFDVIKQMIV